MCVRRSPDPVVNVVGEVHGTSVQAGSIAKVEVHGPRPPVDWSAARGTSNLPVRNPRFTGRQELLARLSEELDSGAVALCGLGGVGKSQVALEHAHRGLDRYAVRWWVRAGDRGSLISDLVALADALGLDISHERAVALLLVELGKHDDWLLVLDNAENPDVAQDIPFPAGGHVVVTSRARSWAGSARVVTVAEMAHDEAVALLDGGPAAAELSEALGFLPLALAQARAYLDIHGCSVSRYLDLYEQASAEVLRTGPKPAGYPHTVATTWLLHFRALSPAAVALLELTSVLAPDSIPLTLLLDAPDELPAVLRSAVATPVAREGVVGELVATSLFTRVDDDAVRVHRLVQEVTRSRLTAKQQAVWTSSAVRTLFGLLPDVPGLPEHWRRMAEIGPHARALGARTPPTAREAKRCAVLLSGVGMHLSSRGEPRAALELFERALPMFSGRDEGPPE
jgi:hypothetical protein